MKGYNSVYLNHYDFTHNTRKRNVMILYIFGALNATKLQLLQVTRVNTE
jgi:hypothetical protein